MSCLYNPVRMTEQEVRDTFVARAALVDTLLQLIERQPDGAGVQHAIITGPRGMGKTTILLMVQFRIAELELSKKWQPIKFPEESYSINDLADLWIETLHLLAAATNDPALESELNILQNKQASVEDAREHAWALIKDWSASHQKRLVLLIDNFDLIIEQISEDQEKSRLRDVLMNDGTVMVIGTAVSFFKEAQYDKPFYHFFRLFDLTGLTHEDVVILLKRRAQIDNIKDFDKILEESRGRFRALEYFTGGNPRLILMLYRVVTEWGSTEVRKSLEKLLDEVTPFYKARTEVLPPQQRKILDHIARESAKNFEGLSPSDIASATRMKANIVSMQLKRLAEAGYVRSATIKGRSSCYTLAEPLYAIWYQMRFSRTAKERMLWLVSFLKIWFELPQLLEEVKSVRCKVEDFCKVKEPEKALYALEHGKYLLEAMPDGPEKFAATTDYLRSQMVAEDWENIKETAEHADLSKLSDEELMVLYEKKVIEEVKYLDERAYRAYKAERFDEAERLLKKLIRIGLDSSKIYHQLGTVLSGKGQNINAIEFFDKALQLNPDQYITWYNRAFALDKLGQFKEAVESYDKALQLKKDYYSAWYNRGIELIELGQTEEAIKSFDKALLIKPDKHEAWHNRGIAFSELGQFKEAIESYDRALKIKPDDYQSLDNKGVVLLIFGNLQEALKSFIQATMFTNDRLPWEHRTAVSLDLAINALSENKPDQAINYLNEARKSEPIIGPEQWMSLVLKTLLSRISIEKLPNIRNFIVHAGLDQQFFPLIRAIDYLETNNEELIEKLSPEYRKIVMEVAKALKERHAIGS